MYLRDPSHRIAWTLDDFWYWGAEVLLEAVAFESNAQFPLEQRGHVIFDKVFDRQ